MAENRCSGETAYLAAFVVTWFTLCGVLTACAPRTAFVRRGAATFLKPLGTGATSKDRCDVVGVSHEIVDWIVSFPFIACTLTGRRLAALTQYFAPT